MPAKQNIYGWTGAAWNEVLVDAAGHLQVDVLSGAGVASQLYGYDGADWQALLVESAARHHLRVSIWQAGYQIHQNVLTLSSIVRTNVRCLQVMNTPYLTRTAGLVDAQESLYAMSDADTGLYSQGVGIFGFNGTNWDKLRSYGTGILKVGRAEVGLLTARMTGTGQAGAAGARKLYWLACNPSAGNSVYELSDDIDGSTAVVLDCFSTSREGKGFTFDPPMEFANGIYVKTFTNITSITFGYL